MNTLIEMKSLKKTFGGIKAIQNVDLELYAGEVHGLLGENGAGKSTLMRILCGLEIPDNGVIQIEKKPVEIFKPTDAQDLGIGMIPQELILIDGMTVTENIFLGYEIESNKFGFLNQREMRAKAIKLLKGLGSGDIDPDTYVGLLSKAEQQIVAIARRIIQGGKVFIMDEPTSALTENETEKLFTVIRKLCSEGKAVVFISHRLEEVLEICDRFTVLRDGKRVVSVENTDQINKGHLISFMIGNEIEEEFPHTETTPGEKKLEAQSLSFTTSQGVEVKNVNFDVCAGEVVGITGLVGVGKTELAQSVMGLRKLKDGQILLNGKKETIKSPVSAVKSGIGYVTEDRRGEGLVLGLKSLYNMTLSSLQKITRFYVIRGYHEKKLGLDYSSKLNMKNEYIDLEVKKLSGGNQQKAVVIRQMMGDSEIIIFDEPTKGIDVGAKAEIARLISSLSKERKSILIFSSEPREILGVSDRIYVLNNKGFQGPFKRGDLDYKKLMAIEFGEKNAGGAQYE